MGLGKAWKKAWSQAKQNVSNAGDAAQDVLRSVPGLDYAINPLAAQNLWGSAFAGSLARGADARTAFANASGASGDLAGGGSSGQWSDLAAFNAALLGGAAAGAAPAGAAAGFGWTPAVSGSAWTGAAVGAAALPAAMAVASGADAKYSGGALGGGNSDQSGSLPPDMASMYANDPSTEAQFKRLRKAASMLGRAGTIKNKGSATSLGGEGALGSELSLTGA